MNIYYFPGINPNDLDQFVKFLRIEKPEDAVNLVCRKWGFTEEELKDRKRNDPDLVFARHICFFLLKEKFRMTNQRVANFMNRKAHATTMNSCQVVKNLWVVDRHFKKLIISLLDS